MPNMRKKEFHQVAGHGDTSRWTGYAIDHSLVKKELTSREWAGAPLVQVNSDDETLAHAVFEAVNRWEEEQG